ncbi:MAG: DUF177 domain-containing protein [Victivallales bacterium]|nr:DUF177 domain-containing protein [Victivallales bacterium]
MISCPDFQFQIQDLPDQGIDVSGKVAFASLEVADSERIRCPKPLSFQLHIAPVQEGVLVMGQLTSELLVACDRCLAAVPVPIAELSVCHHLENVEGVVVDLTKELREDILLVFPHTCLCQDGCPGLCPDCGKNLNDGPCSCGASDDQESPWAALDGLDLTEQ